MEVSFGLNLFRRNKKVFSNPSAAKTAKAQIRPVELVCALQILYLYTSDLKRKLRIS